MALTKRSKVSKGQSQANASASTPQIRTIRSSPTNNCDECAAVQAEEAAWSWLISDSLFPAIVLGAVILLIYPYMSNPFILDDGHKIQENPDIQRISNLPSALFYPYDQNQMTKHMQFNMHRNDPSRPLTFLVYTLLWALGGGNQVSFHAAGAIVHAWNSYLARGVLITLLLPLFSKFPKYGEVIALAVDFSCLCFAFTPVAIGTAMYAYALSDTLATGEMYLMLLRMFSPLRNGVKRSARSRQQSEQSFWVAVHFTCAILFKQTSVTVLVWVSAWYVLLRIVPAFSKLVKSCPQLLPSLASISHCWLVWIGWNLLRFWYLGGLGDLEADPSNSNRPYLPYLGTQPLVWFKYVAITLTGRGMSVEHAVFPGQSDLEGMPSFVLWILVLIALGAVVQFIVSKQNRAPCFAAFLGLIGWCICVVAPTSLLMTTDCMAERRHYAAIPVIFFIALVTILCTVRRFNLVPTSLCRLILIGVVLFYASQSSAHLKKYSDPISAWQSVLDLYPSSVRANNNLGNAHKTAALKLIKEGSQDGSRILTHAVNAAAKFDYLITADPTDGVAMSNLGDCIADPELGSYLRSVKSGFFVNVTIERAHALFRRALEINPLNSHAWYNWGLALHREGKLVQAERCYFSALHQNPTHITALNNLGVMYMNVGLVNDAQKAYNIALELDPDNQLVISNIGTFNRDLGKFASMKAPTGLFIGMAQAAVDGFKFPAIPLAEVFPTFDSTGSVATPPSTVPRKGKARRRVSQGSS